MGEKASQQIYNVTKKAMKMLKLRINTYKTEVITFRRKNIEKYDVKIWDGEFCLSQTK